MRTSTWWVLAALLLSSAAQAACPPEGTDPASLQLLREQKFAVPDDVRAALVAGLPACLADPDPALRDGVAYEGLSTWLRAGQVDVAQQLQAIVDGARQTLAEFEKVDSIRRETARALQQAEGEQHALLTDIASTLWRKPDDFVQALGRLVGTLAEPACRTDFQPVPKPELRVRPPL